MKTWGMLLLVSMLGCESTIAPAGPPGERGEPGEQGPPGGPGAQGPPGALATNLRERVYEVGAGFGAGGPDGTQEFSGDAFAECDAGDMVLTGRCETYGAIGRINWTFIGAVIGPYDPDSAGWRCIATVTESPGDAGVNAYAMCLRTEQE